MALRSTIFKADIQIADVDRGYYADHSLTLARHPSETDERLMVRLLAFALNADELLTFGKGLSDEDEPDLWRKNLTGAVELWIETGLPDPKRLRRARSRADSVCVYTYGRAADIWWKQNHDDLERLDTLNVWNLPADGTLHLAQFAQRAMNLQFTVQEGSVLVTDGRSALEILPRQRMGAKP